MNCRNEITYITLPCSALTDEQLKACKKLFDENYGKWDEKANKRPGDRIRFPERNYQDYRKLPDAYVALAMHDQEVIGQAFYLRKETEQYDGKLSWVMQLVVHRDYRRKGIAKTLLLSIWGFSSDYMWGLATSNALTIKTLEATTLRKVTPGVMRQHQSAILFLKDSIPFAKDADMILEEGLSVIDTNYPVDQDTIKRNLEKYQEEWQLGELKLGQEWLAFTFRDQPIEHIAPERFEEFFENSEKVVRDAYSRMDPRQQPWAQYADKEIDYLLNVVDANKIQRVYDIGCGIGRHAAELAKHGFRVTGFDYADKILNLAREDNANISGVDFQLADCRELGVLPEPADLITCLYDVIGTFTDDLENEKIIQGITKNVKLGGYIAVSVMNFELTEHIAIHKTLDVRTNPMALFELKAAKIMQKTGDIFNPEHFLLETSTGLIYRKEQFEDDKALSAEYVIRDRRYTKANICALLQKYGFEIIESRYVQAGKWDIPLNAVSSKAKEILVIGRKVN